VDDRGELEEDLRPNTKPTTSAAMAMAIKAAAKTVVQFHVHVIHDHGPHALLLAAVELDSTRAPVTLAACFLRLLLVFVCTKGSLSSLSSLSPSSFLPRRKGRFMAAVGTTIYYKVPLSS